MPSEAPKAHSLTLEPIATPKRDEDEEEHDTSDAACYCVKCGTVILVGQTKCSKCFTPVTAFSNKNKVLAGFLAFFLGGFGVHRLYLGQWWGLAYLFFYWTFIPSIVSLIEAIVFWSKSQKAWDEKYGQVPRSGGSIVVILIVGFFVMTAVIGILAAIALPAYQDYTLRAKVQQAMPLVTETRNKVASFILKTQTYPSDHILVGLPDTISNNFIESITLQDEAKLAVAYRLPNLKDKNTIIWTPTENKGAIIWSCTEGTMPDKYRPADCRTGSKSATESLQRINSSTDLTQRLYSNDQYISIRVPESWKKKELVAGAAIGAANLLDENYVVVLEDSKADFDEHVALNDYVAIVQAQLASNITAGELVGQSKSLTIANLPAEQFVYQGSINGLKVAYVVTLLESNKHFYRILTWTLQSRLDKNKELLQNVSDSVRFNK